MTDTTGTITGEAVPGLVRLLVTLVAPHRAGHRRAVPATRRRPRLPLRRRARQHHFEAPSSWVSSRFSSSRRCPASAASLVEGRGRHLLL